jgi:hypothetical protein
MNAILELVKHGNVCELYIFCGQNPVTAETVDIWAQTHGAPVQTYKANKDKGRVWTVTWDVQP